MADSGNKKPGIVSQRRNEREFRRILMPLACMVVLVMGVALMVPAISMTRGDLVCDMQEHAHSKACYEQVLTCGLEEGEGVDPETGEGGHVHTKACYDKQLTCDIPEHKHSDACYEQVQNESDARDEGNASEGVDGSDRDGENVSETAEETDKDTGQEADGNDAKEIANADSQSDEASRDEEPSSHEAVNADMPAQTFEADLKDANDNVTMTVRVEAPKGAFRSDVRMKIDGVDPYGIWDQIAEGIGKDAKLSASFEGRSARDAMTRLTAVDIAFTDADGNEVLAAKECTVKITTNEVCVIEHPVLVRALKNEKTKAIESGEVVQKVRRVNADEADESSGNEDTLKFKSSEFGTFAIAEVDAGSGDDANAEDDVLEGDAPDNDLGDEAIPRPATSFMQELTDGEGNAVLSVSVRAPKGALPEGSTMELTRITDEDVLDAAKEQAEVAADIDAARAEAVAVDIAFNDADGELVDPLVDVHVAMSASDVAKQGELAVLHLLEEEAQSITTTAIEAATATVEFDTASSDAFALVYTSITADTLTANGETYTVTVSYGDDAEIPDGAELNVREIIPDSDEYAQYLTDSAAKLGAAEDNISFARFFDIEIAKDGRKIEPAANVDVSIELKDVPKVEDDSLKVVHFGAIGTEALQAECAEKAFLGDVGIDFETSGFSVYGVIVEPGPTGVNGFDGYSATISNNGWYLGSENIDGNPRGISKTQDPSQVAVWTFESAGSTGSYYISTTVNNVKQYMHITSHSTANWGNAFLSTDPQVLTVEQNGSSYVIGRTENGTTYYLNHWGSGNDNRFAAYAYRASGDAQLTFSPVTPFLENNDEYMVIVKQDDDYYIVLNDGTLSLAEYDEATRKVKVDNPMLWYYTGDHIYHHSKEVDFTWSNLPSDYYYKYINPSSETGLSEDDASNTHINQNQTNQNGHILDQRYLWNPSSLAYSGHKLRSTTTGLYIGVDENVTSIIGRCQENSAAEIYLAKVTDVPVSSNMNHTVNHIDISIEGGATMDVPLAYGDYYYTDHNGNRQTLTVSANNNVTLPLKIERVPITPADMKNSQITAYSAESGVLSNAFYVTGYSGNKANTISTNQVRIEGAFKVSDLPPYTNTDEDHLTDEQLQARLDHRIYYTVSVTKNLTFDWMYEYEDDQGNKHKVQLYNANNQPLSSTSTVNLSKSFDYWDPDNECPPIKELDNQRNIEPWKRGHIIYDTSGELGSGMDFKLESHGQGSNDTLAIEITKTLLTDTGEVLHPRSPVTNQFIVYQNRNATQDDYNSVIDVGVGDNSAPVPSNLYDGYSGIHADTITVGQSGTGLVYDYDVKKGMTYITEDADSIHREIVDASGKRWKYVKTYVETEYAWRASGDEGKIHHADGTTGIPEVLGGPYGTWTNSQGQQEALDNGFLPFFVYNVYERADDTVTLPVTKTWDDFASSGYGWEATFKLQYMERKVSGNAENTAVTEWTDYHNPESPNDSVVVTLKKEAGVNQWSVSGTFGDLPKHREENGNVYERQYSADEVSFMVWRVQDGPDHPLYSYDGTNYFFGEGADESIYRPFYDHDANENWDGDWHLQISNSVGQKIEPRNINIDLRKTWEPNIPNDASATFVLKRYKQTEYVDYQSVQNNANIDVQLQTSDGTVLSNVFTKSGLNMYIDATFAPNKTGTLTFEYGGHSYSVSNETETGSKVTVRSDPIPVVGSDGSRVIVRMTGGDLRLLAEGTATNIRITDRSIQYVPAPDDSFSQEISFPIAGKTGEEAWQYTFENLPVEEGEWNPAGTLANITIYSYYLEEPQFSPGNYQVEVKDSDGNLISSSNRIYNSETISATNSKVAEISIAVRKIDKDSVANANTQTPTLPGATFMLEKYTSETYLQLDSNWSAVTTADTDSTGVISFSDLPVGYYMLTEDKPPTGYIKSTDAPKFRVKEQGGNVSVVLLIDDGEGNLVEANGNNTGMFKVVNETSDAWSFYFGNEPGKPLPTTGGLGVIALYLLGAAFILGGAVVLASGRRRQMSPRR